MKSSTFMGVGFYVLIWLLARFERLWLAPDSYFTALLGMCPLGVMGLGMAIISYRANKDLAIGKGWPIGCAVALSIVMGLSVPVCLGGLVWLACQWLASAEINRYGVERGKARGWRESIAMTVAQMKADSEIRAKNTGRSTVMAGLGRPDSLFKLYTACNDERSG